MRNVRRPGRPVKILFVSANPGDRDQLMLDKEYRAIEHRIRRARHRDAFRLIVCPAARRSDLQEALLEHAPHVVHFACHGSQQGALSLLSEEPSSDPVSAESLAAMFEVLHDQLLLVVFNACFASTPALAVRSFARATIGMQSQVTDRASIAFASALYGALAYGRSVQESFDLGRAALNLPESQLPQLFERMPMDACKLRLVAHRRTRVVLLAALVFAFAFAVAVTARLTIDRRLEQVPAHRSEPFLDRPFLLDTRLRVQRSQDGRPIILDELRSGDVLMDGERLRLWVKSSAQGYLYIAFCSQRAGKAGIPGLSVFPEQGGIPLRADQMLQAPVKLIVDDHPGPEALYLILSRRELSQSDARLDKILGRARLERATAECGMQFRSAIAGTLDGTSAVSDVTTVLRGEASIGTRAAPERPDKAFVTRGFKAVRDESQPGVDADEAGVVVLRYEFTHVPGPSSSR